MVCPAVPVQKVIVDTPHTLRLKDRSWIED